MGILGVILIIVKFSKTDGFCWGHGLLVCAVAWSYGCLFLVGCLICNSDLPLFS